MQGNQCAAICLPFDGDPKQTAMNPRIKKLIGTILMVLFVALYALAIAGLAPRVLTGASKAVELIFYVVAGLAWALPLMPLIRWMEKKPRA
jgi:hypothetical protein